MTTTHRSVARPRRSRSLVVALALWTAVLPAQNGTQGARVHVQTLASDAFEGREAGTSGERRAADYIAAQLARIGAKPLPGPRQHVRAVRLHGGQPRRRLARHA